MPVMTDRQSVAANLTVANAVAGKTHEFISEASIIRFYATGSVVGMNMTLFVGDELVVDDQEVNAQNRLPLVPDDFIAEAGAFPGDRIVLKYRNTTGGAIVAFSRIDVVPA